MSKFLVIVIAAFLFSGCALFDRITIPDGCAAFKLEEVTLLTGSGLISRTDWACGSNWGDVMGKIIDKHPTMVVITDAKVCKKEDCDSVAKALAD